MHVTALDHADIRLYALELRLLADGSPDPAEVGADAFLLGPILSSVRRSVADLIESRLDAPDLDLLGFLGSVAPVEPGRPSGARSNALIEAEAYMHAVALRKAAERRPGTPEANVQEAAADLIEVLLNMSGGYDGVRDALVFLDGIARGIPVSSAAA